MQYLVVFLLVGLGLASAYTSDFDDELSIDSEKHGPVGNRLKEAFERIVNKIKERFDGGKGIDGGLMKKAQDLFDKLKNSRFPIGDKIRSIFEDMKSKMGRTSEQHGPVANRLKEAFERIVNRIKERFDGGKGIDGGLMKKAQDLFDKLKNSRFPIGDKIRSIFQDMKSKMGRTSEQHGPVANRLKEAFERIVNRIKERFDGGKGIDGGLMKKAQDLFDKLKNSRFPIGDKIRSIFEDLKSKMGRTSEQHGPVANRLKEAFESIVNRIKERFDGGKGIDGGLMKKAQDLFEKLKNSKFPIGDKIRSIFEDLRSKMGRNGPTSQDASISDMFDLFRRLKQLIKEKFDSEKLKEKVEELFGKGNEIGEKIIEMLKTKGEKAKQKILDWIDRSLPDKEERAGEVVQDLQEFLQYLQRDLLETFQKFGNTKGDNVQKAIDFTTGIYFRIQDKLLKVLRNRYGITDA